ncbi:MAG: metal-dependent transcriptional regulator [Eubacteriales bacterium]|nr:metal-dependent transcriptional regulator [Eubacteriales bacterium]
MSYIQHKSEESVEDYLETIFVLSNRMPSVRSIDIATELGYSKPSVSIAMKNLKNRGYITTSEEGFIHLTEEGRKLASSTYERHTILCNWFISLGVSPETAAADACRVEHDISQESFDAIKKFISEHPVTP